MSADRAPVVAGLAGRLRSAVEVVGLVAVAVTHLAGAVKAITDARRGGGRCS